MLQYFLFILLSTTSVKANTGCTGNYQYERQPVTSFNHCNPVRTALQLTCSVLVPSDSTTVTVDWYRSKNISECGRNITEEQGRFTIYTSRGFYLTNIDRIITDLTITSPQTDTGYYWCQVNDPSYNEVFISSNKAPVFDTGYMTPCSGTQSTLQARCAVGSVPPLICTETAVVSTSQTKSKITVSPGVSFYMTRATTVTTVDVTSNTPILSGVISNNPVPSGVISNTPIPSDQTSNNTTTVAVIVVTVLILLAALVLVIAAVIIIIFVVVKRQPHHKISLQKQPINTSKCNDDNKSYPLTDIKSNQSNKPPRPPSRPPPYSSNQQEKETEIKHTKSNQSNKPPRPPSPPPPYSSKPQKKETEIEVTANSAYSSKKETEIKDEPVTVSSAGFSNELPTYAVLDWENKAKSVTKPKEQSPPKSDAVIYTTIAKNTE